MLQASKKARKEDFRLLQNLKAELDKEKSKRGELGKTPLEDAGPVAGQEAELLPEPVPKKNEVEPEKEMGNQGKKDKGGEPRMVEEKGEPRKKKGVKDDSEKQEEKEEELERKFAIHTSDPKHLSSDGAKKKKKTHRKIKTGSEDSSCDDLKLKKRIKKSRKQMSKPKSYGSSSDTSGESSDGTEESSSAPKKRNKKTSRRDKQEEIEGKPEAKKRNSLKKGNGRRGRIPRLPIR